MLVRLNFPGLSWFGLSYFGLLDHPNLLDHLSLLDYLGLCCLGSSYIGPYYLGLD
ncbi:hypothetical protein D3C76_537140 [compost metagenome]